MHVIFQNGGKQYKASKGDILLLDKLAGEPKSIIELTNVLAILNDGDLNLGKPFLDNVKVKAEIINHGRGTKVVIFKKRRRKDSKTKRGFRRDFTRVRILDIEN